MCALEVWGGCGSGCSLQENGDGCHSGNHSPVPVLRSGFDLPDSLDSLVWCRRSIAPVRACEAVVQTVPG